LITELILLLYTILCKGQPLNHKKTPIIIEVFFTLLHLRVGSLGQATIT